jgi:hypothetical protein
MIRCGRARWDAKDKICEKKEVAPADVVPLQNQMVKAPAPRPAEETLKKTEAEAALERLLAERKKLDNYWSQ